MGRAGGFTWRSAFLIDAVATGDSLRILFVNSFAEIEFFVVLVRPDNGTDLSALATAGAL
jgi:hypothetical protein